MKKTPDIIKRFLFNLKLEFSGQNKAPVIPCPCKATTNELTWMLWMDEFPKAEFTMRKIGVRIYYMIS